MTAKPLAADSDEREPEEMRAFDPELMLDADWVRAQL